MKVFVDSCDVNTDVFNFVAGVLQGDTLAPILCIICLDYVLQTSIDLMKENGFRRPEADDILQKLSWIQIMQMF